MEKNNLMKMACILLPLVVTAVGLPVSSYGENIASKATPSAAAVSLEISVSTEAQLASALSSASEDSAAPTVITIMSDITLTAPITLSEGKYATLSGSIPMRRIRMDADIPADAQISDTRAVFTVNGVATISNLTIDAGHSMRVVTIMPGGSLTLNSGATITGGKLGDRKVTGGAGVRVHGPSSGTSSGTFVMNAGSRVTDGQCTGAYSVEGIGVYVGRYGRFTMNGGSIDGNVDLRGKFFAYGGGVYVNNYGGRCEINGGTIEGNTAYRAGGGIYVMAGIANIAGGTISGNKSAYGGGVYTSGEVIFTGGVISGNEASASSVPSNTSPQDRACGGGVFVAAGSFTMEPGALIMNNTASLKMKNDGSFNAGQGGGIYALASFIMNGGRVTGNAATTTVDQPAPAGCGGGIAVAGGSSSGNFVFTGGTVSGNTARNQGGGVYINPGGNAQGVVASQPTWMAVCGRMTVSGSPVCKSNLEAEANGNIYLPGTVTIGESGAMDDDAELYIGSEITELGTVIGEPVDGYMITAADAYAFADNNGRRSVRLDDGKLKWGPPPTGNETPLTDAEIALEGDQTFSGSPLTPKAEVKLSGQTLAFGTDYLLSYRNNIDAGSAIVAVTGIGLYTGRATAAFTISPRDMADVEVSEIKDRIYTGSPLEPGLKLSYGGHPLTAGIDHEVSYGNNVDVGQATVTAIAVSGGNYKGSLAATFTVVSQEGKSVASDAAGLQDAINASAGSSASPQDIYILSSITVAGTVIVPQGKCVRLIGNEDELSIHADSEIGNVLSIGGELVLDDVTVDAKQTSRAVCVSPGACATLAAGGNVTGGSAVNGAGIYNNGRLRIDGGSVTGNSKTVSHSLTGRGGGVYNAASAAMTLLSGEISDNFSTQGGGVYNLGVLSVLGGRIEGNSATSASANLIDGDGGGLYNAGSTLVSGGAVTGNRSGDNGGGIRNRGDLSIFGGAVSDNTCEGNGAGVYTSSSLRMTGGTIEDNTTKNAAVVFNPSAVAACGGGVFVGGGSFTLSGGAIRDNAAVTDYISSSFHAAMGDGGGVYVSNDPASHCVFTMSGGQIEGNRAVGYNSGLGRGNGGGVYVAGGRNVAGDQAQLYPGEFDMSGGLIYDNFATDMGGGAYLSDGSRYGDKGANTFVEIIGTSAMRLSGTPVIAGNAGTGLWLANGVVVNAESAIASTPGSIGIVAETGGDALVLHGVNGYALTSSDAAVFVSEKGKRQIEFDGEKNVVVLRAIDLTEGYSAALDAPNHTYDGTSRKPKVAVKSQDGNETLKEGVDYTLSYSADTVNKGQKTVRISGEGDYKGRIEEFYEILPKSITSVSVAASIPEMQWNGSQLKPVSQLSVSDGAKRLLRGTDYLISGYGANIDPGVGTVTLQGMGNYEGTRIVSFSILKDVSALTVSDISDKAYTGSAQTPRPIVMDGAIALSEGADYTLEYADHTNTGRAVITIIGQRLYHGSRTLGFNIVPKKANVKKLSRVGKGKLKVLWKKDAQATGYEVVVALDKKFKKGKKSATIKSSRTTSKIFKGLKRGETYYVKMRAYKLIDGGKKYGPYGAVKKLKVK